MRPRRAFWRKLRRRRVVRVVVVYAIIAYGLVQVANNMFPAGLRVKPTAKRGAREPGSEEEEVVPGGEGRFAVDVPEGPTGSSVPALGRKEHSTWMRDGGRTRLMASPSRC